MMYSPPRPRGADGGGRLMSDIPRSMAGVAVTCTVCGTRPASWVQVPSGTICFDCNVKRAARAVLRAEIAARQTALRQIAQAAGDGADAIAALLVMDRSRFDARRCFETIAAIAR